MWNNSEVLRRIERLEKRVGDFDYNYVGETDRRDLFTLHRARNKQIKRLLDALGLEEIETPPSTVVIRKKCGKRA